MEILLGRERHYQCIEGSMSEGKGTKTDVLGDFVHFDSYFFLGP